LLRNLPVGVYRKRIQHERLERGGQDSVRPIVSVFRGCGSRRFDPRSMLKSNPKQFLAILAGLLDGSVSIGGLKSALPVTKRPARPWI
jgi:hypothetical protein